MRSGRWVAVSRRVAALAGWVRIVRSIHSERSGVGVAPPFGGGAACFWCAIELGKSSFLEHYCIKYSGLALTGQAFSNGGGYFSLDLGGRISANCLAVSLVNAL